MRFRNVVAAFGLFAAGAAVPLLLSAGITLPHTFSNNVVADAEQVNENFAALATASGDAKTIKGVTVDDAAKADGKVLRYDGPGGKLVYGPGTTTASGTSPSLAPGACLTVTHGFGTNALGYSAWMTDPATGTWIPVTPGYEPGTTNLALNRTAAVSGTYSCSTCNTIAGGGNDGIVNTSTGSNYNNYWSSPSPGGNGWWQVDLGATKTVSTLRIWPGPTTTNWGWSTTAWEVRASADGLNFTAPIATGACTYPGSCTSWITHALPAGTTARYLRVTSTAFVGGATVNEFEAYGTAYAVSQVDANAMKLCNHTDVARGMSLVVWR